MTTSDPAPGSTPKKLPRDPSVEHLRKQAKALHKAYQRGLPPATQRIAAVFTDKSISLTDAQHVVAIEYGFPSWPKLAAHIRSVTGDAADWHRDPHDNPPKAANDGDLPRLKQLVDRGDYTQHDLDLALARCWGWGERDALALEMAEFLIASGADPNGEYGGNYGPILIAACEGCNVRAIRFLLEHGAAPNADLHRQTKYAHHNTPMRMLLGTYVRVGAKKRREAIDLLLEYGADVPPEVDDIALAIFRDDADVLGILLASSPGRIAQRFSGFRHGNVPLEGATYLHQAVEFQAARCVDLLCTRGYEHGIHINTKATPFVHPDTGETIGGQTPIFHCIASNGGGNFPMFEHLIDKYGRWIDFSARATIRMYCWTTNNDATLPQVTPLGMAEANANPEDANPYWKSQNRELEVLRQRDARSAVQRAVEADDFDTAAALMDRHPEHVGPHLWCAAVHDARSLRMTQELLRRGLDPNARDAPRGALDFACYVGDPDLIAALVEAGAKVNKVNTLSERPADLLGRYEPLDESTMAACRAALGLPGD